MVIWRLTNANVKMHPRIKVWIKDERVPRLLMMLIGRQHSVKIIGYSQRDGYRMEVWLPERYYHMAGDATGWIEK